MTTITATPNRSAWRATLISEVRKLTTTRMWWVLLIVLATYMVFMAGILAFSFVFMEDQVTGADGQNMQMSHDVIRTLVYSLAPTTGYVFPVIVGTLAITSEYRHRTITAAFLADPNRGRVLAAKMVSNLVLGAIYGVVSTVAVVGTGAIVFGIAGWDLGFSSAQTWADMGLSALSMTVWTLVGVGFGTLITNQIAAIIVVVGFTQLAEPILRMALPAFESVESVAMFLPGAAGEALGGAGANSLYNAMSSVESLNWWQGGLVLLAYAVVMAVIGRFTTLKRDIT